MSNYIKFKCDWEKAEPLPYEDIRELNDTRNKLYDMKLIGAYDDGIGYGNLSKRYNDKLFIISGSATGSIENTNEEHYTLITEYDIDNNYVKCKGPLIASSETMTHAALYQLSDNINCVIHVHSLRSWKNNINKMPTTGTSAKYGTPDMAYDIKRLWDEGLLNEHKVIIMGGHKAGIILFGENIPGALEKLNSVE